MKKGTKKRRKKRGTRVNFHIIFLIVILLVFLAIVYKLFFWGSRTREDNDAELDSTKNFDTEPLDAIVPLDSFDNSKHEIDDDLRILFIGNGSLAEDKDADTNMANIVQKNTGATVYNCAIPGSFVTMYNSGYKNTYPYDALSFYFLCTIFASNNTETISWAESDLRGFEPDVKKSLELLQSIDYSQLDIICINYDAHDYLEQRLLRADEGDLDPQNFVGALRSGIDLIQEKFPQIRIIVMSPTYAYAVDEEGNYSDSFARDVLETPLVDYITMEVMVCRERRVSFVDNFYGSVYQEIADDYLKDNVLLNPKGNELLADRFIYALNRFNEYDFSAYE